MSPTAILEILMSLEMLQQARICADRTYLNLEGDQFLDIDSQPYAILYYKDCA